ncbi:hypothetical protein GCM10010252_68440 [Streptomyces aureoverticillatus]|nr:hypothetical protein GCM10010252_68440 [Streptomyces aureoverticillatus]
MELTRYVDNLRQELSVAGELADEETPELAELLVAPPACAIRPTSFGALGRPRRRPRARRSGVIAGAIGASGGEAVPKRLEFTARERRAEDCGRSAEHRGRLVERRAPSGVAKRGRHFSG